MSNYTYFTKRPGSPAYRDFGDQGRMEFHGTPHVIRLPEKLGGQSVELITTRKERCPCGSDPKHLSLRYVLKGPIQMTACVYNGYLWYKGTED